MDWNDLGSLLDFTHAIGQFGYFSSRLAAHWRGYRSDVVAADSHLGPVEQNYSSLHSLQLATTSYLIVKFEKYASVVGSAHRATRPWVSPSFRSFTISAGCSAPLT